MSDAAPVLIWETDQSGVIFINQRYLDFFGADFNAVRQMGWARFLHPDDADGYIAAYREAFARRQPYTYDCRFRRADGQYRWLRNIGQPFGEGRFVGSSIDITGSKRVEEALRESERRYHALFETMDEGFCIIEFLDGPHGPLSDYVHVEANPAYARHAGIPNVVGQKLREMVPDEADDWIARYRPVLETGQPIRFEQELVATGRRLDLAAFRVEPPERRQVAVLFTDITARWQAEADLEAADRRKDEFLAMLAHELRNPLAPIRNAVQS